jgi:hypothetical protein
MKRERLTNPELTEKRRNAINKGRELRTADPAHAGLRGALQPDESLDESQIPDFVPRGGTVPLIYYDHIYNAVIDGLKKGNYLTVVAASVGISPQTIKNWAERGQKGENKLFYRFWKDAAKAQAESEMNLVKTVTDQAELDWKAGLEILSRRWPDRWAKTDFRQTNVNVQGEVKHQHHNEFAEIIISDPRTRDIARELINRTPELLEGRVESREIVDDEEL